MINSYDFGEVVIDGKRYTSDVIIYPNRVKDDWWRKEGHQLCIDDLEDVLKREPDVIVVGTGSPGLMKVLPETEKLINSKEVRLIIQPTKEACQTYNQLISSQKVVALLHLTC
ncbi:MAG: hypothetical protein AMJ91_07315 [candidate division Zixibacteria bacterium SM23_73_3]|nr:MAG: hypothetical protein AMJ91_07315 [candidate division Zixibacteria bacterium SM23_73_3]